MISTTEKHYDLTARSWVHHVPAFASHPDEAMAALLHPPVPTVDGFCEEFGRTQLD